VGQFERRIWENAVKAEGSMVASPLTCSDATLAEAWQFVAAKGGTVPGEELLPGGAMEDLGPLADGGWRHFARPQGDIRTAVEVSRSRPASGQGCLRLVAAPANAEDSPVVIETPPVWISTPPLAAPAGKLVEISAQVMGPEASTGSGDGLRGPQADLTNPFQTFLAHTDAPEAWLGDVLVSGGKHYGHLEIDVTLAASGMWDVSITPAYAFPLLSATNPGEILSWERRTYDDSVTFVAVPEPTGLALLATAALAAALGATARRFRQRTGGEVGLAPQPTRLRPSLPS